MNKFTPRAFQRDLVRLGVGLLGLGVLGGCVPAAPAELPTHYDLIVNMRTARALGITLPPAFLARVDEFIE